MSDNKEEKFKKDLEYRLHRIKKFGKKYRWKLFTHSNEVLEYVGMFNWETISNCAVILKINFITYEIQTTLTHPRKGKTTLVRKGEFSMNIIESIFRNPRVHMQKKKIKSKYVHK